MCPAARLVFLTVPSLATSVPPHQGRCRRCCHHAGNHRPDEGREALRERHQGFPSHPLLLPPLLSPHLASPPLLLSRYLDLLLRLSPFLSASHSHQPTLNTQPTSWKSLASRAAAAAQPRPPEPHMPSSRQRIDCIVYSPLLPPCISLSFPHSPSPLVFTLASLPASIPPPHSSLFLSLTLPPLQHCKLLTALLSASIPGIPAGVQRAGERRERYDP